MKEQVKKILDSVEKETSVPKVYALVIKTNKGMCLWQVCAYSLESAFLQAKNDLQKLHPGVNFNQSKIELFNDDTIEDLLERSTDITVDLSLGKQPVRKVKVNEKEDLNALMKQIIDNKDKKLFEEKKSLFSESQISLLKDKLKIKK